MPKLKTHKGANRRFRVSGTGKVMRRKGNISHLRRRKSAAARRLIDEMVPVHKTMQRTLRRLLPYS